METAPPFLSTLSSHGLTKRAEIDYGIINADGPLRKTTKYVMKTVTFCAVISFKREKPALLMRHTFKSQFYRWIYGGTQNDIDPTK